MRVTATVAKNRFGSLCRQAKQAPVVVEKAGQPDTVLISYSEFQRLLAAPDVAVAQRRKKFSTEYAQWLAALNRDHDELGLWNDGVQLW